MAENKALDEEAVREIRRLMQERREKEMEDRFGRDVRGSDEYKAAQRQRAAARRRAEEQREKVADQRDRREAQDRERAKGREERTRDGQARESAGRHQRDAQNWNSPPAKGKDAHPQRLSGDELEAVRERMREARERIRRDDQAMAARAAKAASQGHIHAM